VYGVPLFTKCSGKRNVHREVPMKAALSVVLVASFLVASPSCASEELGAIPIPASIRPTLQAACTAWGRHIEELLDQHQWAGELTGEDLKRATDQFYAAQSFCSMGKLLDSLAMYERIPVGRVKQKPIHRPLW
jgi:hypothetical protein